MTLNEINKLWLIFAGLVGTLAYMIGLLIWRRSFYRNLPCPPHSIIWGHLKLMGQYMQKLPPGSYTHNVLTQMKMDYDLPDIFYLDLWPVGPRFVVCTSPDACAISTTKSTYDMPGIVAQFFEGNIGPGFIEATNGSTWKHLHKMLAPGLTPGAVKTYNDSIVNEAVTLHTRLREITKVAQVINLRNELGKYPFQVIANILFGETLDPQAYEDTKGALEIQSAINATNNPIEKRRLRRDMNHLWRRIETVIEAKTRARFAELQQQKGIQTKANSKYLVDRMLLSSDLPIEGPMDGALLDVISSNVKGLLVAGYGTTTDTSSYIFMLLSVFPQALEKLREEHDRIFDKDFNKTVKLLQDNPSLLNELEYTTAVINETLRMFPIGFGVRSPPPDITTVEYQGRKYPVKGHNFAICSHTMHFSSKYFDEPKEFNPQRFLSDTPTFPRNAYRPFERGLRSCLGQALAMEEMKIMLVLVARWFDFELKDQQVSAKPVTAFTNLDSKLGRHAFQTFSFTASPAGPVKMRVSLAKER